jgi:hypothetical protein
MNDIHPHELLVAHLEDICRLAKEKEFHDFENNKFPMPKMELVMQLENIIRNTKAGLYDN